MQGKKYLSDMDPAQPSYPRKQLRQLALTHPTNQYLAKVP